MADLAPLKYGRVTGRFVAGVGDSDDAGYAPDVVPLSGSIVFRLSAAALRVVTASPVPTTVYPQPIVATLDSQGYLSYNGQREVPLLATDDPATNPTNLQWTVPFDLRSPSGQTVQAESFRFALPADTVVDLTTVAPIATPAENLVITKGDRGEPGPNTVPTVEAVAAALTQAGPAAVALAAKLDAAVATLRRTVTSVENVYGPADFAPALDRIVATGGGWLVVPYGVTLYLWETIALPPEVRHVTVNGRIVMMVNAPVFTRDGKVVGVETPITAAPNAGNREITAAHSDIAVGDWIFVASRDTLPGTSDKLGYLRKVRSLTPGVVTMDTPLPRSMPTADGRRFRKVAFAPSILIDGEGEIFYNDPAASTATMVVMTFVDGVYARGIFAHDGGSTCVSVRHSRNVDVDMRIARMMDDLANGHVGYGVNVGGACRNVLVRGFISQCRHAVTTNPGPGEEDVPEFPFYGEPENWFFLPITEYCSNKAIDSHRAGYGGRMIVNDTGSGGAAQNRADAVYIEARSTGNFFGDIVTVGPNLVGKTVIGPVIASYGTAKVIRAYSDVMMTAFPVVYGGSQDLFAIEPGVSLEAPMPAQYASLSAHQSFASATLAPVVGMVAYMAVQAHYVLTVQAHYKAATTVDGKLAWSYPAGATINWTSLGLDVATSSSTATVTRQELTQESEATFGGVGVNNVVTISARVVNGYNAGPLQLLAAQRVESASSPLEIRAGSYMKLERVR